MIGPYPVVLEGRGVRLEPLTQEHHDGLAAAAADGQLWQLAFTFVPEPGRTRAYIDEALDGQTRGQMIPWAVREMASGSIVGSTRYHDIIVTAGRVEIGYTWYARRWQRTHVNTACKLLLLSHAFETLGCGVLGLRTDILNLDSQKAIESLGAVKDGIIRRNMARRDGTVRDTVMYSVIVDEWAEVKRHLEQRLARHAGGSAS